MHFTHMSANYDAQLKLNSRELKCFSPKQMKKTLTHGGATVAGEIAGKNSKNAIGMLKVDSDLFHVLPHKSKSRLLWRNAGYLKVGDGQYIAVLKSRIPFLILLLLLLLAMCTLLGMRISDRPEDILPPTESSVPVFKPDDEVIDPGDIVITPDHPLPPADENVTPNEGDDSEKNDAPEGGGSVSMIYTLEAALDLSDRAVTLYFKNPTASTHSVTLDMYIISGGQEYLVAQSGLIAAGFGLEKLTLGESIPQLSEGVYTGLYRLHCYDPVSGEQTIVVPEIAGVNVTVTN